MCPASLTTARVALISIAVLAWLFIASYTGSLGRNNGQSYLLWFAVGLIGGPVGLLFAYLYFQLSGERKVRERFGVDERAEKMPRMVRCPGCGQTVPARFEACQFCGAELHAKPSGRRKRR